MNAPSTVSDARVVKVAKPERHYRLLQAPGGEYLGTTDGETLGVFADADDAVMWVRGATRDDFRHAVTGMALTGFVDNDAYKLRDPSGDVVRVAGDEAFTVHHGPAELPSASLEHFRANGWVCLPCVLGKEAVDGLQKASCSGAWSDRELDRRALPLTQDVAVARASVEPVSLWLIRQYLQTDHIRLGHSPSFAVLDKDDGKADVLAWHADFPYLWGITPRVAGDRIPVHDAGPFAMAVQRNICITDFTKENGATLFKLGSHARHSAPPEEWGLGSAYSEQGYRAEHGLPYAGPEAEVLEAPAGSIIIYDARTWHRTGVNVTDERRAAMLQAVIPMYIMPFMDTARPYKAFLESDLAEELNGLERHELEELMVHKIVGPMGQFAIGIDRELTDIVNEGRS
jgi:hypothetical protein